MFYNSILLSLRTQLLKKYKISFYIWRIIYLRNLVFCVNIPVISSVIACGDLVTWDESSVSSDVEDTRLFLSSRILEHYSVRLKSIPLPRDQIVRRRGTVLQLPIRREEEEEETDPSWGSRFDFDSDFEASLIDPDQTERPSFCRVEYVALFPFTVYTAHICKGRIERHVGEDVNSKSKSIGQA